MLTRFRVGEKNEDGFTLIELLVVIIIIGILAAIAVPLFLSQRKRAVDASVKSDLRNAASFMESYFSDNQTYPTSITQLSSDVTFGKNDTVTLVDISNVPGTYCIKAVNNKASADIYFDSDRGGLQKPGVLCS